MCRRSRSGRIRTACPYVVIVGFLSAVACGREDRQGGGFERWDSAGISIRVTDGAVARNTIAGYLDTVPDLQLGSERGPESTQFHRITRVVDLVDGRIAVLNYGSSELRVFDRSGRLLQRLGGPGDGPGEFRAPRLVPSMRDDALLIFDHRSARFTRMTVADSVLLVSRPGFRGDPVGAVGNRVLMREMGPVPAGVPTGQSTQYATFRLADLESGTEHVIGTWPGREWYVAPPTSLSVPFHTLPSAAAHETGFLLTYGELPEIVKYDSSGRRKEILRLREDPQPVTRQLLAQYLKVRNATERLKELYGSMALPSAVPAFSGLLVDRLGWIWAEMYRVELDGPRTWIIFDTQGRARGYVVTPDRFDVYAIGADHMLGRWRDELDVEHVRRYRLIRAPTGQ